MINKIPIKTEEEITVMREGGKVLGKILAQLKSTSKEGVDIWELEENFISMCGDNNVFPACKNYVIPGFPPFPTGLCISLNEQAVHCFPVMGTILKGGDLLTLDTVIKYKEMYLDSAITFGIGKLQKNKQKLLDITKRALQESINVIKPGVRVGNISHTMQSIVEKEGFSVLKNYAGHGIGRSMHEPPEIPCYGDPDLGIEIPSGATLAVEPLVCEKSHILEHNNYWETKTIDGGNFVQVEHTVLVTDNGNEVLTEYEE